MRRALAFLAVAIGALAVPAAGFAHATVQGTDPSYRERLGTTPASVVIVFDQAVTVLPDAIVVVDAHGRRVSGAAFSGGQGREVATPVHPLAKGTYTVRWRALSSDGHPLSGLYTFGVQVAAPPPTEAFGASGPTRIEHIVRWLYFLALSLSVGGMGFGLLVLRGVPPEVSRRFYRLVGLGLVAVLEVGTLAFILRAEDILQLPFARLLYADLSPIAGGTRLGVAFSTMTLGFVLVGVFTYLAWLTQRAAFLWPALVLGLGFSSGLSLSGHSAVDPGSTRLTALADWVHLSAALLWVGGLVFLVACVWPLAPGLRRSAFLGFSRLATVLIALLLLAGIYLSIVRLPSVSDLWGENYGQVLLVKIGLVSVALLWGAFHHFVVRPALERRGGTSARVSRSLAGEAALATAILLVAAVLVDSKPPAQDPSPRTAEPVKVP
ncbi:MAG: copper resistance protein CopC [Gaiellaceae bacterium]